MNKAAQSPAKSTAQKAVTIYHHRELFNMVRDILREKAKKRTYKGPKTPSQFFGRASIKLIRQEGRKLGFKLPPELTNETEV